MKCFICKNFSIKIICQKCLDAIPLKPHKHSINAIPIYTFFRYEDIDFLLHTKYYAIGSRIFTLIAQKASQYFFAHFNHLSIYGIGIDDYVTSIYSHTGVILKHFSKNGIKPIYGQLRARNCISYAGKSLKYRQTHTKDFIYNAKAKDIMIVDDVITTGTTLKQAIIACQEAKANVHFGIVLCNAMH